MNHAAIIHLIGPGVRRGETAWADLGSGDGAFTLALRELLGGDADIYSVDADPSRLARQQRAFQKGPGTSRTRFIGRDFTAPLDLPPLDGILMANALHFVENQPAFLHRLHGYLTRPGKLLIVEYDINRGSMFVPYPVPYSGLAERLAAAGFDAPALLETTRSRYWSRIYSALAVSRA